MTLSLSLPASASTTTQSLVKTVPKKSSRDNGEETKGSPRKIGKSARQTTASNGGGSFINGEQQAGALMGKNGKPMRITFNAFSNTWQFNIHFRHTV